MTGTLGLFSLVDLFQLIASSSRTGRLVVDHPKGTARVYFNKGKVVHADFDKLRGEEAIYALFSDERGSFEFSIGLPSPASSIEGSTENLLLEVIRRLDEARRTDPDQPQTLADDMVPIFAEDAPDAGNLTLYAQEIVLLRLVDGKRDLKAIAKEAGLDLAEVKQVASRLIRVGALAVQGKRPRVARLVAQLARDTMPPRTAGVDGSILSSWEKVLGKTPDKIACRRPNGQVDVFGVQVLQGAGPYIYFSRETLFTANLAVNTALLVKPAF